MAHRVAVLNAKGPQTPTGQSRLHSRWAQERLEPGDRVIFSVWSAPSQAAGVMIQGVYDVNARLAGTANEGDRQPEAGRQAVVMETAVMAPPHFKLHTLPKGWTAHVDGNDTTTEVPADGEDLDAGESPIWRMKFPDTGGEVMATDFQNFYRGVDGMFFVSSRSGAHQFVTADAKVPTGEAYLDVPMSAYMICNPVNGVALTAHCLIH